MTFEPSRGEEHAKCSCASIERVSIFLSTAAKHTLPVARNCPYSHNGGIEVGSEGNNSHPEGDACTFANGTRPQNYGDLWECMNQVNCAPADDWLQMAVFRDPRPASVSAYYHLKRTGGEHNLGEMETFASRELPITCQWVAIRYIIFSGWLGHQSEAFWYEDALADPLTWHYRWLDFVGLQLPAHQVNFTAERAVDNDFRFAYKHIDKHPGQENATTTEVRHFEDEVSVEMLEAADAVLRKWLPPVLLARLGV